MTLEATSNLPVTTGRAAKPLIHPRWVRITHWINALAIFMMIGSGWQIYDASPLFRFLYFPSQIALGEWLAGALLWHFAAMWLFVINFIVYVTLGIATGRFRQKLFPIRPRDVWADVTSALRGKLSHDDLTVYNAVQRLLYLGVILAAIVLVLSGLSRSGSRCSSNISRRFSAVTIPRVTCTSSPWRRSLRSSWSTSRLRCWCRRACAR